MALWRMSWMWASTTPAFRILFQLATNAHSAQVTLVWDPNTQPELAGYKVYYGLLSDQYSSSVDVGNQTSYTLSSLENGKTYYLAATAYDREVNRGASLCHL
jgi:fibronectin type 3 domain-containing protein